MASVLTRKEIHMPNKNKKLQDESAQLLGPGAAGRAANKIRSQRDRKQKQLDGLMRGLRAGRGGK